jgi:surface antigen
VQRGWTTIVVCCLAAILAIARAQAASYGGNCVTYARHVSGVKLDGNAGSWWTHAEGRYRRGQAPAVGAVLVFKPFARMRHGHVAVVSRILSRREILVDQANWVRGQVIKNMSVVDASPRNDWTVVRVLEVHSHTHGRANPTYGFIYPHAPRFHGEDRMMAADSAVSSRRKLPIRLAVATGRMKPIDAIEHKSSRRAVHAAAHRNAHRQAADAHHRRERAHHRVAHAPKRTHARRHHHEARVAAAKPSARHKKHQSAD